MKFNSAYLESKGYWYSNYSGIWYQKFYKNESKTLYGWEAVTREDALDALMEGHTPADLELQNDDNYDLLRDQQLGL